MVQQLLVVDFVCNNPTGKAGLHHSALESRHLGNSYALRLMNLSLVSDVLDRDYGRNVLCKKSAFSATFPVSKPILAPIPLKSPVASAEVFGERRTELRCFYCSAHFPGKLDLMMHISIAHADKMMNGPPVDTNESSGFKPVSRHFGNISHPRLADRDVIFSQMEKQHDSPAQYASQEFRRMGCEQEILTETNSTSEDSENTDEVNVQRVHSSNDSDSNVFTPKSVYSSSSEHDYIETIKSSPCHERYLHDLSSGTLLRRRSAFQSTRASSLKSDATKSDTSSDLENVTRKYYSYPATSSTSVCNMEQGSNSPSKSMVFACIDCDIVFPDSVMLELHLQTHVILKPYVCPFSCGKRYSQKSSLNAHIRSHTGDKPFLCPVCGKAFSRKPSMKRHQLAHTGQKPYECQICLKKFARKDVLYAHCQRTHGVDVS